MDRKKTYYKKGMKFGKWRLLNYINSGGNGAVWEVERETDKEKGAIKLLKTVNRKTLARFKNEINVIKKNKEINGILPIYDSYISENNKDTFWYVMPIASSIDEKIKQMSSEEIIKLITNIGEILAVLHEKDIVHRDIKPGNVLFYNEKFYLADFGLVDYPDKEDLTQKFESVGPKWTMAPEMRRNPKQADGKKADVYSLAKTMWILLTRETLGFDGQYSILGKNSLRKYVSKLFLGPLDRLLNESTSDEPDERPSMSEFLERIKQWKEQNEDFQKRNPYEWKMIQEQLFPTVMPSRVIWEDINDIIKILNIIGSIPSLNHMFYPTGGGMDLLEARLANEPGCLELDAGFIDIVKPKRLIFESIGKDTQWNYFRLEIANLKPIIEENDLGTEHLTEIENGYESYSGGRGVIRYFRESSIVIFQKTSVYNKISGTYDGRHSKVNTDAFKTYVKKLEESYR